ncbi:uncharacterized protein TrAFT101_010471 [Trichoderma asperellum]|uniref:uncharacterized protein n=1 Tax=Trichoderma asperellum TaxID=101201 RepID=UPI003325388A|nr:hypothetical protein TrAFT101_010471 [Trichoderma asperellum]
MEDTVVKKTMKTTIKKIMMMKTMMVRKDRKAGTTEVAMVEEKTAWKGTQN